MSEARARPNASLSSQQTNYWLLWSLARRKPEKRAGPSSKTSVSFEDKRFAKSHAARDSPDAPQHVECERWRHCCDARGCRFSKINLAPIMTSASRTSVEQHGRRSAHLNSLEAGAHAKRPRLQKDADASSRRRRSPSAVEVEGRCSKSEVGRDTRGAVAE